MRTVEVTLYTAAELREHDEAAFERAREDHARSVYNDAHYYVDDIYDSLRALRLLTAESYGWIDAQSLTGGRALAWIENHILGPNRIPWTGKRRRDVARYGPHYRPGKVKPCPLTGYYADEVLIDALVDAVKRGHDLWYANRNLDYVAERLANEEIDSLTSEEGFLDRAECNEWEFYEDGRLA